MKRIIYIIIILFNTIPVLGQFSDISYVHATCDKDTITWYFLQEKIEMHRYRADLQKDLIKTFKVSSSHTIEGPLKAYVYCSRKNKITIFFSQGDPLLLFYNDLIYKILD